MALKLSDYFKASNIRDFVQGEWNMFKNYSTFFKLSQHSREQALYRAVLCRPCHIKGSCIECGCSTPDLFYAPHKEDAGGKWGEMLNAEDWEKFKEEHEIVITEQDLQMFKEGVMEQIPTSIKRIQKEKDAKLTSNKEDNNEI